MAASQKPQSPPDSGKRMVARWESIVGDLPVDNSTANLYASLPTNVDSPSFDMSDFSVSGMPSTEPMGSLHASPKPSPLMLTHGIDLDEMASKFQGHIFNEQYMGYNFQEPKFGANQSLFVPDDDPYDFIYPEVESSFAPMDPYSAAPRTPYNSGYFAPATMKSDTDSTSNKACATTFSPQSSPPMEVLTLESGVLYYPKINKYLNIMTGQLQSKNPLLSEVSSLPAYNRSYPLPADASNSQLRTTSSISRPRRNTKSMPAPLKSPSVYSPDRIGRREPLPYAKAKTTGWKPSQTAAVGFRAEKPKPVPGKEWVRINSSTQGKSSRSGKLNAQIELATASYSVTEHPIGQWSSPSCDFDYSEEGELNRLAFTAEEINSFLFDRPQAHKRELTLWIQKAPADSRRRYPTIGSSQCRFRDCPHREFKGVRTISVGSMRVAFDEQYRVYGNKRDPYHVAAYVHLYCLERFCDFPRICQEIDVQPDNRVQMCEPRQIWAASLGSEGVFEKVNAFIRACKSGYFVNRFPQYPLIQFRNPEGRFPYEHTLCKAATVAKLEETVDSKKAMMRERGLTRTNLLIHKGDVQMYVDAKLAMNEEKRNGGKVRKAVTGYLNMDVDGEEESDEDVPTREKNAQGKFKARILSKTQLKSRKRQYESSEESSDIFDPPSFSEDKAPRSRQKAKPRKTARRESTVPDDDRVDLALLKEWSTGVRKSGVADWVAELHEVHSARKVKFDIGVVDSVSIDAPAKEVVEEFDANMYFG